MFNSTTLNLAIVASSLASHIFGKICRRILHSWLWIYAFIRFDILATKPDSFNQTICRIIENRSSKEAPAQSCKCILQACSLSIKIQMENKGHGYFQMYLCCTVSNVAPFQGMGSLWYCELIKVHTRQNVNWITRFTASIMCTIHDLLIYNKHKQCNKTANNKKNNRISNGYAKRSQTQDNIHTRTHSLPLSHTSKT